MADWDCTYIQAMWIIHGIPPQGIIVSCRLTDNMAQGIHLQRTQQEVKLVNILRYRNTCKHQHSDVWWQQTKAVVFKQKFDGFVVY